MAIVYYDSKTNPNIKYAYESISKWDPVKKRVNPQRRYLGRLNVETGEIIPTSKVRGGVRAGGEASPDDEAFNPAELQDCKDQLEKAQKRIAELEQQVSELTKQARVTNHVISGIRKQLATLDTEG